MVGVGRQVSCSMPIHRCRVIEGVVCVDAVMIQNSPPLSVAVPRNIQNWPAYRQGCSSIGQFPGGVAGKVSSCVMTWVGTRQKILKRNASRGGVPPLQNW